MYFFPTSCTKVNEYLRKYFEYLEELNKIFFSLELTNIFFSCVRFQILFILPFFKVWIYIP